jgi:uncharacterized protein involved in outer membrane biogenesis
MTRGKIVAFIAAVLVASISVLAIIVVTNLDRVVKTAIERYGSEATGTDVRVGSVKIELVNGKGNLSRLTVGNPPGFNAPHLFSLGAIGVTIDPRTAAAAVIVIDEVHITGPQMTYERNVAGQSNVDIIRKSLASGGPAVPSGDRSAKGGERRLRIRKLVIESGTVEVRVAGLGGRPRTATLNRVELHDIGGTSGAAPDQVARQVMTAVLSDAARQAAEAGAERLLEKGLDRLMRRIHGK